MVTKDAINNEYFEWMYDLVCGGRFGNEISFRKLFMLLHSIEFRYSIRKDGCRADDGIDLRYRFPYEHFGIEDIGRYIDGPCSVFEMILALAIRCEETIMDNPAYGDRTGQWFWGMINNLGLGSMEDSVYDRREVEFIVNRFLDREYEANGKGGLFTVRNAQSDLRNVEIWWQAMWFLNNIT